MAIPIEVEPGELQQSLFAEKDLTTALYGEFNATIGGALATSLVQPVFDVPKTMEQMHKAADEARQGIFHARFQLEAEWIYADDKPIHMMLASMALSETMLPDLAPDDAFMDDLHRQIDKYDAGVWDLKLMHDRWPLSSFIYMEGLHSILSTKVEDVDGNAAFEIVEHMKDNPDELTLPAEYSDAMYLLTYLPWRTRQLTRRMLVGNHIVAKLKQELGENRTPEEETLLQTLHSYYLLNNMVGQQWEGDHLRISEETQVKIAAYSVEQLATLAKLQALADDRQTSQRFVDTWERVTEELYENMKEVSRAATAWHWQQIDIGHGFEGFRTHELAKTLRLGMFGKGGLRRVEFTPSKSGLKAAILEDDDAQRALWQEATQGHTSYTASEDLSFATPKEFSQVVDDPNIGLFLIDIQNGSDLTAGIRMGEEVLRRRLAQVARVSDPETLPQTKIIVWSASTDAVTYAEEYFRPIMDEINDSSGPDVDYMVGGSGRSGGGRVHFSVRRKTWQVWGDVE